jgi:hypothetical protein
VQVLLALGIWSAGVCCGYARCGSGQGEHFVARIRSLSLTAKRNASARAYRICAVHETDILMMNNQTAEQKPAAIEAAGVEVRRG